MKKRKLLSVPALILIDAVALGVCLCVFALFHHVLQWEHTAEKTVEIPQEILDMQTKPSAIPEETAAPEPTEEPEWGQFGEKFKDKFTDGDVISTDTLYNSESIRAELSEIEAYDSVIHMVDIYVRNVTNLRTTFGGSDAFDGTRARGLDIATRVSAVCSINGDYPGFSNGGRYLVLRNGSVYNDNPNRDVLMLYYDGTMKAFTAARNQTLPDFDLDTEIANGAYQGWSFGPSLLNADGTAAELYSDYKNPRSVIGCYEPGHYCFFTVDGRSKVSYGMTVKELAEFAQSLGLMVAYNLDGGQSSTLTFGSSLVNVPPPEEGVRDISDIIYIAENAESAEVVGQ